MTDIEGGMAVQSAERYRGIAGSIRALMDSMQHSETREQLRLLALEYERLAECIETVSDTLQTPPAPL